MTTTKRPCGPNYIAGKCDKCGCEVFHRTGKPGEYDHTCTTKRHRGRPPGYRAKDPKTARLVTMVTPGTKAAVEAAAKRSGISAGEYVRRAIAACMKGRR